MRLMEDEAGLRLAEKAQELGDVELAVLLCLIAGEHCIIEAEQEDVGHAEHNLQLICKDRFGLDSAVLHCSRNTTLDDFGDGLLIEDEDTIQTPIAALHHRHGQDSFFSAGHVGETDAGHPAPAGGKSEHRIADIVIARDLHLAGSQIQTQALELIRSRRLFARTAVHATPKRFLLIALNTLVDGTETRLEPHLNDHFCLSHFYERDDDIEDGDVAYEREDDTEDGDVSFRHNNSSTGSIVRSSSATPGSRQPSFRSQLSSPITYEDISSWMMLAEKARLSAEVRGYLHNVVAFLRMHRAVYSGVTATATRNLYSLSRALAPLHGIDFITPSLVSLAARKVYPHRIRVVKPEDEMSLMWGSNLAAVTDYLAGITAEDVVEDILERVEVPL